MPFSITHNLLSGSMERPDILTLRLNTTTSFSKSTTLKRGQGSRFTRLSWIPLVSTVLGPCQALLGLVHTIGHFAIFIFTKNQSDLEEVKLGAKNIVRGSIATLPIIGNIILFVFDIIRTIQVDYSIKRQIAKDPSKYDNCATLFFDGREVAKQPIGDFENKRKSEEQRLGRSLTVHEMAAIINHLRILSGLRRILSTT